MISATCRNMFRSKLNQNTKLSIIGTVGVPAKYGGFETLAHYLVEHLAHRTDMTVFCSSKNYSKEERQATYKGAKLVYLPVSANGIWSTLYDMISMIHAMIFADVLIVLGVSGAFFLPVVKWLTGKRIIVNIDGLEWRRDKWQGFAKKYLLAGEKMAIAYADEIIADNEAIQQYVYERYGRVSLLIEYGGDHNSYESVDIDYLEAYPFLLDDYAFKVSRIEPENNVQMILEAFKAQASMPLVYIGNWNHSTYSRSLYDTYKDIHNIHLVQPIYDTKLLNMFRSNCRLYIHGHGAGGTNPSLVEAMYLGLPVIAYDVVYNKVTTENKGLYFKSSAELATLLSRVTDEELSAYAWDMSLIAHRRYTWATIANKYYNTAVKRAPTPVPAFTLELPVQLSSSF